MWKKVRVFVQKELVFCVAAVLAVLSCFFVPVDQEYLGYIDVKTLVCLFCMMAVICALQNTGILQLSAKGLIRKCKNTRTLFTGLVFMTFVASVFIANDMALLTFLPLTIVVLQTIGERQKAIYVFILQNIAANLGGMLTPFGNPQNIYLFTYFQIPTSAFFRIMGPLFLAAIILLFGLCLFFPKQPLTLAFEEERKPDGKRLLIYSVLFCLSVLIVFQFVPYLAGFFVVLITLLLLDQKAIAGVDYMLLLTFFAFFIFSGNLSRMAVVHAFISRMISGNELFMAIGATQIMCNVPTAILFSKFTMNYAPILIAVNIGSFGTLISSLASLITYKLYTKTFGGSLWYYLGVFTALNGIFLVALTGIALWILR